MAINKVLRNIIAFGIFLVPFIVLYVANTMFFPFITGKNFAFRIIVEIVFALWLVLIVRDNSYRPRGSSVLYSALSFLVVITIADMFGENFSRSLWSNYERMEGLITHFHLFAYLLVAGTVLNTERLWNKYFDVILGVGSFLVATGALQLSGVLAINQGGVRLDATLGNAAYLAVQMIFLFFIAVFCYFRSKQEKRRSSIWLFLILNSAFLYWFTAYTVGKGLLSKAIGPVIGVLVFLVVTGLVYWVNGRKIYNWVKLGPFVYLGLAASYFVILVNTATRGSVIGLITGGVFAALTVVYNGEAKQRKNASIIIAVIFAVLIGFVAVKDTDFVRNNDILGRLATSFENVGDQPRFMIWNMAYKGFLEHPILGWGQENFNLIFNKYYEPRMYAQEPWFDRAHDVFFDWLTAGGILGLLAYLGMFLVALYVIWLKTNKNFNLSTPEKSVFTALLIAYFIHNIFVFDNLMSYIMFFTVLSYLHFGSAHVEEAEKVKQTQKLDVDTQTKRDLLSGAIILGLILSLYFLNVRPIQQSKNLILALSPQNPFTGKQITFSDSLNYFKEALSYNTFGNSETREQLVQRAVALRNANMDDTLRGEFLRLADEQMREQIKSSPGDARYLVFLGNLYSVYGQAQSNNGLIDVAIAQFEEALKYSPKKQNIMFQLVGALVNKKDYARAYEVAKLAYDEEPRFNEAGRILAIAAVYNKKIDEAEAVLKEQGLSLDQIENQLVGAYSGAGMFEKVVAILKKNITANPGDASLHVSLAAAYLTMGERSAAVGELEKAGNINPAIKSQTDFYISEIKAGRNP